ncbi:MAG: 50S ribosomal protein L9 [Chitinivibrionales bacterium]|nr:50S ribosomal protein L9 [Chitinivibrionales bacterium]
MDVILKQDFGKLGKTMDVVSVKEGYARNFLFPRGIAVLATEGNRKAVAEAKKVTEKREEKKAKEAGELAKKIEKVPCTIPVQVGEEDKLYGSVGVQEICDFLKKEGFEVERSSIKLDEPIKQLGVYTIDIELYKNVSAQMKVWVVKDQSS